MRLGILVFPGSNCDHDCYHVLKHTFGQSVDFVWHKEKSIEAYDAIIIPGGFSYGDYLRTGAIARFSPIMKAVEQYAGNGGYVLGICNGFQILLEAGLLPGAMLRNRSLQFVCKNVSIRVENTDSPFAHLCQPGQILRIPVAHADGNFYAAPDTLRELESNNRIIFRYCDRDGRLSEEANPNGSMLNIAGICNQAGNVMGMMPHPERCAESLLGSSDGRMIFESLLSSCGVTNE
jgi:phosphoribosylformylglycinamidine synthase subunit PurQ / glutaminase